MGIHSAPRDRRFAAGFTLGVIFTVALGLIAWGTAVVLGLL